MSAKDSTNREWTAADFAKAKPPAGMTAAEKATFPNTRGAQKTPTKVPVSIRIDPDVLAVLKAGGDGWQSRVNGILRQAVLGPRNPSGSPAEGATIKIKAGRALGRGPSFPDVKARQKA